MDTTEFHSDVNKQNQMLTSDIFFWSRDIDVPWAASGLTETQENRNIITSL